MSRSFLPTALATVLAACTLMSSTAGADDRRSWRSDGHRYSDRRYDDNDRYDRRYRHEHSRDYRRDDRRWHRNYRYDHRWAPPRYYYRHYPRHYRYHDRGYHRGWYRDRHYYGYPSRYDYYDYYPRGVNGSLIISVPIW